MPDYSRSRAPICAHARERRRLQPGVKVLFTSGYTDDHVFARSQPDAAVNFLSKPYRRRELAAKLRDVLESWRRAGSPFGAPM